MNAVKTIATREFKQVLRTKVFMLTTLLGLLGLVALSFLPTIISWADKKSASVVVVADQVGGMYAELSAALEAIPKENRPYITLKPLPDNVAAQQDALNAQVEAGTIPAYLLITPPVSGRTEPVFTLAAKNLGGNLMRGVEQVVRPSAIARRQVDLGITPQQALELQAPVLSQTINLDNRYQNMSQMFTSQTLAYLLLFMLYLTMISYGSILTTGVAAEKGSRVMEMMLVSVRPTQLLAGKIVGLGAASLLQYLVWVAAGLGVSWGSGMLANLNIAGVPLQLSAVAPSNILYFLLYYVLGYLAYSALFAAAGCLVNRQEEATQTMMPVMMLMMIAYFLAFAALSSPSGTVARIASLVPFFTPMVMFTRIIMSSVPIVEILLSILLTIAFIWLAVKVGGRIYRYSVLRTRKAGWFESMRGAR